MLNVAASHRLLEEGLATLESGGRKAAARVFERLFDLDVDSKVVREFADAVRQWISSRRTARDPAVAQLLDRARRFVDDGDAARATALLDQAVAGDLCPDDLCHCGRTWVSLGEMRRAREVFVRACEADPDGAAGLSGLAGIETREGHHERAIDLARSVLALDPFDADAYRALLISSAIRGDASAARDAADRARRVIGDDGFVTRLCDEAERRSRAAGVRFEGEDGRDFEHPIRLRGAASRDVRRCAEQLYAERTLGREWEIETHEVMEAGDRIVDYLVLQRESETRKLFFDASTLPTNDPRATRA
jgi:tetratricopeptide (TPR) repeat protein